MSKEKLEEVIEYEDEELDEDYIEDQEELSDNDKVEQDSTGQVKFKSVNHHKRAEANEVESDGEIATYANYALEYFGHRCALSGEKFVAFDNPVERENNKRITTNLSAEHVVALTTGGNDIIPNIVPTVLQYNIQKNGYYILDWWPKAKDINGNSIYSPEKLLKLVNYMLKSLQIRKELGIKKQPREYRKRLLTPNKIDEFLMQEEIAKELLSDTITATTELEDGKNILTQIPQQEGEIPSLAKQKAKETKITEAMFLTDALAVLEKEEKIPQEITIKLKNMYKELEGEIPFEIEVRRNILSVLEQMGIENNKYTVANDVLVNSDILERIKEFDNNSEIQNIIQEYINSKVEKLKEILSEDHVILSISNIPNVLYNKIAISRIELWKKYRSDDLKRLLCNNYSQKDKVIDILILLKSNGIDITKIKQKETIGELIAEQLIDKTEQSQLIELTKLIIEDEPEKYNIGNAISDQKLKNNLFLFKKALNNVRDEDGSLFFSNSEIDKFSKITNNKNRRDEATNNFVNLLIILKKNKIDILELKNTDSSIEKFLLRIGANEIKKDNIIKELEEVIGEDVKQYNIGGALREQRSSKKVTRFKNALETKLDEQNNFLFSDDEINSLIGKKRISVQELINILTILKNEGVNIVDINHSNESIEEILNKHAIDIDIKNRIIQQLENIIGDKVLEYNIGSCIGRRKRNNTKKFRELLNTTKTDEGILIFSSEEIKTLTSKRTQSKSPAQELVKVLAILKEHGIDIAIIKQSDSVRTLLENQSIHSKEQEIINEYVNKITDRSIDDYMIGSRINDQRQPVNIDRFKSIMFKLEDGEHTRIFSSEEIKKITERRDVRQELIDVLIILKEEGIDILKYRARDTLDILLKRQLESIERISKIEEKIKTIIFQEPTTYKIGRRINEQRDQKNRGIKQYNKALKEAKDKEGNPIFTDDEIVTLTKEKDCKKEIKSIIKENRDNISTALESGEELESEILMAEKVEERSVSDDRGQ